MKEKLKFDKIGVDTRNITTTYEKFPSGIDPDYLITSITSNTDYLFKSIINNLKSEIEIVTVIDFIDEDLNNTLIDHLISIKDGFTSNDSINLSILFDLEKLDLENIKFNLSALEYLRKVRDVSIGVINPKSIDQLLEVKILLGQYEESLSKVGINVCPLNFDVKIIQWSRKNNIEIVGFNSFGGHLSSNLLIESFTIPYLLNFSAFHCDSIVLSGRNWENLELNYNYLFNIYNNEADPNLYKVNKSISKLIKPIKKIIHGSFTVIDDYLDVDNNFSQSSSIIINSSVLNNRIKLSTTINESIPNLEERAQFNSVTEKALNRKLAELSEIKNINFKFAKCRYEVLHSLSEIIEDLDLPFKINLYRIGERSVLISVMQYKRMSPKWVIWNNEMVKVREVNYILSVTNSGTIIFLEKSSNQ